MENSFPEVISDLYRQGKLRMQIVSLQAGSLVVTLRLTLQDPDFSVDVGTLKPMLQLLSTSTMFQVDQQGSFVQGTALRATGRTSSSQGAQGAIV